MNISIKKERTSKRGHSAYQLTLKSKIAGIFYKRTIISEDDNLTAAKLKKWIMDEFSLDASNLLDIADVIESDAKKVQPIIDRITKDTNDYIDAIHSDNKCYVTYSAKENARFKPLVTAFETRRIWSVFMDVEFQEMYFLAEILMEAPDKTTGVTFIKPSKDGFKACFGEEYAIMEVRNRFGNRLECVDSESQYQKIIREVTSDINKHNKMLLK